MGPGPGTCSIYSHLGTGHYLRVGGGGGGGGGGLQNGGGGGGCSPLPKVGETEKLLAILKGGGGHFWASLNA